MMIYYNEHDDFAVSWLRSLIQHNAIPRGYTDGRDIQNVASRDISEFTQCHFFAGIGGWPRALQLAGWPADRPVWTGSCPCQPFSAAGQRKGFDDDRHLWPTWFHLIRQCRPSVIFGEQVASKAGLSWFDAVQADLEAEGYACAAIDLCAAGVGAPHLRQRLWFVAYSDNEGISRGRIQRSQQSNETGVRSSCQRPAGLRTLDRVAHRVGTGLEKRQSQSNNAGPELPTVERDSGFGGMAHTSGREQRGRADNELLLADRQATGRHKGNSEFEGNSESGSMAHPKTQRQRKTGDAFPNTQVRQPWVGSANPTHPTNGFWRDADWLGCRDGKYRPVEPQSFPLAHGIPNHVGKLRGYGNAIVPQVAAEIVGSTMEYLGIKPKYF